MKTILSTLALLTLATPAFARVMPPPPAKAVASIDFNLKSTEGFRSGVITLDDAGMAKIDVYTSSWDAPRTHVQSKTIKLKRDVAASLLQDAQGVADAEIEVTTHEFVCMLFAPFMGALGDLKVAQDYDYDTQKFTGELETALSGSGCWRVQTSAPKELYARDLAFTLKGKLEVIGLDAVSK